MVVSLSSFHEVNDNGVAGKSAGEGEAMANSVMPEILRGGIDEREAYLLYVPTL